MFPNNFSNSINSYAEGRDRGILVNATLLIKQSNFRSDIRTEEILKDVLKNYTELPQKAGIFGVIPLGYEKN